MTRTMNCGLKATVIEDFGCNNITIRFEDGFIKKKCRRDKFREGKISNKIILANLSYFISCKEIDSLPKSNPATKTRGSKI